MKHWRRYETFTLTNVCVCVCPISAPLSVYCAFSVGFGGDGMVRAESAFKGIAKEREGVTLWSVST